MEALRKQPEAVSYASQLGQELGEEVIAVAIANTDDASVLENYGLRGINNF